MEIYSQLLALFPDRQDSSILKPNLPLKDYCSFRIGGPAEVFFQPVSQAQLIQALKLCLDDNIPYFILGRGSNLLIPDTGIKGVVISTAGFNKLTRDEQYISAFCGATLKDLCDFAQQQGLSGLEFASGIPGSVGGAVFMNAGAYDGEIKDVLYCSKCLVPHVDSLKSANPLLHLKANDHDFGYRHSTLQDLSLIHLSSVFKLIPDNPLAIKNRMETLNKQRWDKQPMDVPSAGSVFKRPPGHYTGKLVDECGLRGFRIGDAAVSDKHCGFIVNLGNATYGDVTALIHHVQDTVLQRFGVKLETEIRIIPEQ